MPSASSSTPSTTQTLQPPQRPPKPLLHLLLRKLRRIIFSVLNSLSFSLFMDDLSDDFLASSPVIDDTDDKLLSSRRLRRRISPPATGASSSLLADRLFFVPLKWWKHAEVSEGVGDGVVYTAALSDDEGCGISEIVLCLKRDENDDDKGEGRVYALITESMWFTALKWYSDNSLNIKEKASYWDAGDDDVFPLQIRLTVLSQSKSVLVKISRLDNSFFVYERAFDIFDTESDSVRIWDFSGQMTQFFEDDGKTLPNGCLGQAADEVLLELQVYRLPEVGCDSQVGKTEMEERSRNGSVSSSSSMKMNGIVENGSSSAPFSSLQLCNGGYGETGLLGLTGLVNLGNTCFMNSAIQCLAHTPKLIDYFLGDYKKEINNDNPLGMNGELALAFGDLVRQLWVPRRMPVDPSFFKLTLENFAPQFSGYNQHDSQELLAFLLDGLHEDLNRVKHKPYIEVRDTEDHPDDIVADEHWQNHLARNNSIIVDMCLGQYRSTLVCPVCDRVSVTFDPFMYLSLPLPSTTMRMMTVTVMNTDGSNGPSPLTVTVPKSGTCKDLIQALSIACSLRDDETLLVAEVYNHCILRFLEDPSDSLALIRDSDQLVAYRLQQEGDSSQLVVFMHQRSERYFDYRGWRSFGIPLVSRISDLLNGSQIHHEYRKLLHPFMNIDEEDYDDVKSSDNEKAKIEASMSISDDSLSSGDETGSGLQGSNFQFHFTDKRSTMMGARIMFSKPLNLSDTTEKMNIVVSWSEQMMKRYDISRLSLLPEVFKFDYLGTKPQELVSLDKCLEGFLKEEPLGPEDMWYCPSCKEHRQASKKLDLWRLPEILVVHLKRFSYGRYLKNKLETFVDFPVDKLDLTGFLGNKNGPRSNCYKLFGISNHYGGLGGGHYTAVVYHGGRWYEFNDSSVEPINDEDIKSSAAYVLFYRRVSGT